MRKFLARPEAKLMALTLVLGYIFILAPLQASAQNITVDPVAWDFGDVELGFSENKLFDIVSVGPTPLTIVNISIIDAVPSAFSIISGGIPSTIILLPGESIGLEVAFSPTSLGVQTADLEILSDAIPPDSQLELSLMGVGVASEVPEPATILLIATGLVGLVGLRRRFKE